MMDSQLIQIVGLVLVHFIWQGLLIGLLFGGVRLVLKGQSAVARYNWAVMCLIMLALTPVLTFAWLSNNGGELAASGLVIMSEGLQAGAAISTSSPSALTLSLLLPWIVGVWLCGVMLMSARLGAGWWYVCQLRRHADYRVPVCIQDKLAHLAARLDMPGRVGLAFSNQIAGPMLIGLLKPLILLPPGLINGLSVRQVEMVLAHELSHLHRADHLVNLFQNIVETLLFYHPVVRWISNEIRAERELVSDEQAARLTGDRVAYAETLLQLEKVRGDRLPLAIGMADHQLLARVRYLLAPRSRQSGSVISGMTLLTVLLVSALTALVSTGLQTFSERSVPEVVSSTALGESVEIGVEGVQRISHLPEEKPLSFDLKQSSTEMVETLALSEEEFEPPVMDDQPRMAQIEPVFEAVPAPIDIEPMPEVLQVSEVETALPEFEASPPGEELKMASLAVPAPAAVLAGGALLNSAVPEYPSLAARHSQEGQAEVRLTVDREGRVIDALVIEESPQGYGFGEAALQAVEQWRFEPFTRNGQAIRHDIRTGFDFTDPPPCGRVTGTRISRC